MKDHSILTNNNKKVIITSISGLPNAGKSTLFNKLIEFDLAPVSSKVQTTRKSIKGIINKDNIQIVLVDTPGIFFSNSKTVLEKKITKDAWVNLKSYETTILVFDPEIGLNADYIKIIEELKSLNIKPICFINKHDIKKNIVRTIELVDQISKIDYIESIVFGSAKTGESLDYLIHILAHKAKESDWFFEEELTNSPISEIVAEKFREFLFENLDKEIPYSINVTTESFEKCENETKIHLLIEIQKENHKKIIIGKNGSNLKRAIYETIKKISHFVDNPKIFAFVKLNPRWKEFF